MVSNLIFFTARDLVFKNVIKYKTLKTENYLEGNDFRERKRVQKHKCL